MAEDFEQDETLFKPLKYSYYGNAMVSNSSFIGHLTFIPTLWYILFKISIISGTYNKKRINKILILIDVTIIVIS